MYRLVAALAAVVFLASATPALADGPPEGISQGGLGVLSRDGKTRYVAVIGRTGSVIEKIRVANGAVLNWAILSGYWGIPAPAGPAGEGITRDGKRLIVATTYGGATTRFAVLGTNWMRRLDHFALRGNFAYDALSPDGQTLYLIQRVDASNASRYIVRAYDLSTHALRPGRIADRTQKGWTMEGTAVTRTTSADGRWVYTLYANPGGYPFVHTLDTMRGVAHCIGLPWTADQTPMWNVRLTLLDRGRKLAAHWKSGRPWLTIDTSTWRIAHHPEAHSGFPWRWPLAALLLAAVVFALAAVVPRRRGTVPAGAV